jgi:hypothetical protein
MGKANSTKPAKKPEALPANRERFYITEVAKIAAARSGRNVSGIKAWIYRHIENGDIRAVRQTGVLMLPRGEALKIINGESTL